MAKLLQKEPLNTVVSGQYKFIFHPKNFVPGRVQGSGFLTHFCSAITRGVSTLSWLWLCSHGDTVSELQTDKKWQGGEDKWSPGQPMPLHW